MGQLYFLISTAFSIYRFMLIIYIFMSWLPGARESQFGIFIGRLCEPYLEQFRKFIPPLGMIDISPIVAIFVLFLAEAGIGTIFQLIAS